MLKSFFEIFIITQNEQEIAINSLINYFSSKFILTYHNIMQDKSQAHKAKLAKNDKMAPFSQQVDTPLTAPYIATLKSSIFRMIKIWKNSRRSFINGLEIQAHSSIKVKKTRT